MIKNTTKLTLSCTTLALAAGLLSTSAQAELASRTWVGPNGGFVRWQGQGDAGHYRGTVTVETPDGRTYRRVTKVWRGPYGAYASRRWVGPNGGVAYRSGGVAY